MEQKKSMVWIVGDSTVSPFTDAYFYPRYGWGTKIQEFLDGDKWEVRNLAISGRSTISFMKDENYQILLDGMKPGDVLLVGFGHNDEKLEKERFTSPVGNYKTEGSFAWSLYENYVSKARKAGCTTILCTPIVRRTKDGVWRMSNLHLTEPVGEYPGGDYPEAIRKLGKECQIPVIDMTEITKAEYEKMGPEETIYLHAWNSSKAISVDNTHTNVWGGLRNAYYVMKSVKEMDVKELEPAEAETVKRLAEAILPEKTAQIPGKKYLCSNPEYKAAEFDSNLKQSEYWSDYKEFKGTVFGSVGEKTESLKEKYRMGEDKEGNLHMQALNNNGKIADGEDGLAIYYVRIPSSKNFMLSARLCINDVSMNDQVSFGLMVRDDIYVDQWTADLLGDYVAAGPLKLTRMQAGRAWNNFARKSGKLVSGGTLKKQYAAGDVVEVSIQGTQDGYTCRFGEEEAISAGFDFQLTSVDPEHVYVGMFAARNCDVTFSKVKLVISE